METIKSCLTQRKWTKKNKTFRKPPHAWIPKFRFYFSMSKVNQIHCWPLNSQVCECIPEAFDVEGILFTPPLEEGWDSAEPDVEEVQMDPSLHPSSSSHSVTIKVTPVLTKITDPLTGLCGWAPGSGQTFNVLHMDPKWPLVIRFYSPVLRIIIILLVIHRKQEYRKYVDMLVGFTMRPK